MSRHYDLIAIGAGSAGIGTAAFMAKAGFKTLLIDKSEDSIGGDCLNFGCVPSKALIHAARTVHSTRESEKFGLNTSGEVNLSQVMSYVRSAQSSVRKHENRKFFEEMGMDIAIGAAEFAGNHSVRVGDETYSAKKIILATGSSPRKLDTPGIDDVAHYTNETIFDLETSPPHFLVVGGGPIGCELGQAFAMLGSKVTIIQRASRILDKERPEISAILHDQMEKQGIQILTKASVARFEGGNTAVVTSEGETVTVPVDAVLSSIGRSINLAPLKLENAGIETRDGKLVLDDRLRTTNKNVLACGDIAGGLMFSHAAELHVRLVLNNLFSPIPKKLDTSHFSWVTFTTPEIATFGTSADDLEKQGTEFVTLEHNFKSDDRATTDDYQYGKSYLYLSKPNIFGGGQKILGGTMAAPQAGELIQELILANSSGLKASDIFNKIYPYPTAARVNQLALVDYQEKRLTPGVKKMLRFLFRLLEQPRRAKTRT